MKVLLAHNSTYFPSLGGGDKSNRLLMEALAERGHVVRVVTRAEKFSPESHSRLMSELAARGVVCDGSDGVCVRYALGGVEVRALTLNPQLRAFFQAQIAEFDPDIIVASTDDPGQLLLEPALRAPRARVVYLARATIAVPFGPDSATVSAPKTEMLRRADSVVGVSHYVAGYIREWGGIDAVHVPISLLEPAGDCPALGRFDNPFVSMVNPCAVKGVVVFLELAARMKDVQFAAVPGWGTTDEEIDALRRLPNVTVIERMDDIDGLLRQTSVMVVPSVWAEARSRIVVEAMSRGVPVIASDTGGLREAKLGVPYLVRVNPIARYKPALDSALVPVAEVPPQDVGPWREALERLLTDRAHWEDIAAASRKAALEYAANLNVSPFENLLEDLLKRPKRQALPAKPLLSDDKKKLLALRLKQRRAGTGANVWLPGIEDAPPGKMRLFCLPWAGGGALAFRLWREPLHDLAVVVPVRLPGRETRAAEPAFERMEPLIDALLAGIRTFLDEPFAFFGHSMGAAVAFELTRALRREGLRLPESMHVSGARAPQFRLHHEPPPEPSERDFIEELRRLDGFPPGVLNNPELLKLALPALLADARLFRRYQYQPEPPLPMPIFAYCGDADPNVTAAHLDAWREQTSASFERREFPGGHFYLESAPAALTGALKEHITRASRAR